MSNTKYTMHSFKGMLGDFATEWWSETDWIDHRAYIQRLKDEGEYMKPFSVDIIIEDDPVYDSKHKNTKGCESYRMVILDLTGDDKDRQIENRQVNT